MFVRLLGFYGCKIIEKITTDIYKFQTNFCKILHRIVFFKNNL